MQHLFVLIAVAISSVMFDRCSNHVYLSRNQYAESPQPLPLRLVSSPLVVAAAADPWPSVVNASPKVKLHPLHCFTVYCVPCSLVPLAFCLARASSMQPLAYM